ncbi:hypothetical protein [Agrotis ipsilon virus]|nr:hypothetical protein [Agrotis ipsilon virus]
MDMCKNPGFLKPTPSKSLLEYEPCSFIIKGTVIVEAPVNDTNYCDMSMKLSEIISLFLCDGILLTDETLIALCESIKGNFMTSTLHIPTLIKGVAPRRMTNIRIKGYTNFPSIKRYQGAKRSTLKDNFYVSGNNSILGEIIIDVKLIISGFSLSKRDEALADGFTLLTKPSISTMNSRSSFLEQSKNIPPKDAFARMLMPPPPSTDNQETSIWRSIGARFTKPTSSKSTQLSIIGKDCGTCPSSSQVKKQNP